MLSLAVVDHAPVVRDVGGDAAQQRGAEGGALLDGAALLFGISSAENGIASCGSLLAPP